jgi:hypothetical protein
MNGKRYTENDMAGHLPVGPKENEIYLSGQLISRQSNPVPPDREPSWLHKPVKTQCFVPGAAI